MRTNACAMDISRTLPRLSFAILCDRYSGTRTTTASSAVGVQTHHSIARAEVQIELASSMYAACTLKVPPATRRVDDVGRESVGLSPNVHCSEDAFEGLPTQTASSTGATAPSQDSGLQNIYKPTPVHRNGVQLSLTVGGLACSPVGHATICSCSDSSLSM